MPQTAEHRANAPLDHRATGAKKVLAFLQEHGAIESADGFAVPALRELMGPGAPSVNALTKCLRLLEQHGLIRREIRGQRTFRIEPVPAEPSDIVRNVAQLVAAPTPPVAEPEAVETAQPPALDDSTDYEALAAALLRSALRAMTHSDDRSKELRSQLRAAEQRIAEAEERAVSLLEANRSLMAQLSEALDKVRILEHNAKVLNAQADSARNRRGTPIEELIPVEQRRALAKLAREVPARRG